MINAIGEAALQQSIRLSASSGVQQQEAELKKTERQRENRPVVKSEGAEDPKLEKDESEKPTNRMAIERGAIIVERYDAEGRLISKTPPGYVPIAERV